MADGFYRLFRFDDAKVQVDSAIRDGEGRRIDTNYAKKVQQFNMISTGPVEYIMLRHTLGDIPSAIQLYIYDPDRQVYEQFMADTYATESMIIVDFSELDPEVNPLQEGVTYYIKALI